VGLVTFKWGPDAYLGSTCQFRLGETAQKDFLASCCENVDMMKA
jgi:hypothetical protein